jgi:RsiW-degrading membrane proteinase PrsW (M82 family)
MENPPSPQAEPPHCIIPIHKPSKKELVFFFATGIVVSIPFAAFFEAFFPSTALASLLLIIVGAPFIEELAKVFPLFYRHGETERSIVTLGLFIGLGFGVAEFAEYVAFSQASPIARLPGIIFHASSATITAYGVAKNNPIPYYLIAVFLHLANNFLAVVNDLFSFFIELLVLITTYLLAYRYWHMARKDVIVV